MAAAGAFWIYLSSNVNQLIAVENIADDFLWFSVFFREMFHDKGVLAHGWVTYNINEKRILEGIFKCFNFQTVPNSCQD